MVNYSAPALDATFAALSDATRRGILARLALGETSISDLAAPYDISLPAVSKHLRVLERANLVGRRKDGRVHRCRLIADPMKGAADWIEKYRTFWDRQVDSLDRYLDDSQKKEKAQWRHRSLEQKTDLRSGERSRRRAKKSSRHGRNAKG
ncbi:MAG: metalloregulator ArsR/SmtB family transcription factor [Candidatus Acidiferrales bacterium]